MPRRRRIHPVLMLPAELMVEEEVLGESFAVDIAGISLELTFPIRGGTNDWPWLVAPPGPNQHIHDQLVAIPASDRGWGYRRNDSWEVWAVTASLLVAPDQNPRDAPEVKTLGEALDPWFFRAREWILVLHGIPRAGLRHSRVTVLKGMTPQGSRWGTGGVIGSVAIAGLRGGSIAEVHAAFERATEGQSIPVQYLLLLDAKTASIGGELRRAVIDAGTAAEVALATAIEDQLRHRGVNIETVEAVITQANGLAGLIVLFSSLGGHLAVSKSRAINELADKRNKAAHGGLSPTQSETSTALRCAGAIVASATPLSFP